MERYDWSIVEAHPASDIAPMSDELAAKVAASPYPPELIDRALAARLDRDAIEAWCDTGFPPPDELEGFIALQERILTSTLTTRSATWADEDMLIDLWANAPETVDDWSVTVERSPNPYAQYRLQEHPVVTVMEDRRVALGMTASSVRNTLIGGERISTHFMSSWRVRDGFRGLGLSGVLRSAAGPGAGWFGLVTYWFFRPKNASIGWMNQVNSQMSDRPDEWRIDLDQLTASIFVIPAGGEGDVVGSGDVTIRPTEPGDLDRCIELINRTHDGLDLFRPYTRDYLEMRLDDPYWGPKPVFIPEIYGWAEHRVVEVDGEIVACGGLWDRGRDIREIWRRGDETHVEDPTALMDFGCASGDTGFDALATLIRSFVADSAALGRSGLMAPLEFLPEIRSRLADLGLQPDTRELHVMPFTMPDLKIEAVITKPYTDLAYW